MVGYGHSQELKIGAAIAVAPRVIRLRRISSHVLSGAGGTGAKMVSN